MKLKVLGSGSKGNCYIIQGEQSLLLECGIKWEDILKGLDYQIGNVSCLISHQHKDHCRALKDVLKASIDVYSGEKTFEGIFTYPNRTNPHIRQIEANKQVSIGRFIVLPFSLEHDVPNMGFLIQHPEMGKLVYITDSYYCKYCFKGLNHIMIECNYSKAILDENLYNDRTVLPVRDRVVESHMSLETCKDFLMANDLSQVKDIVLMHLSDGNSDAEQFKREIEGLTGIPTYIAESGLEIEL
jgi:phosphoribosyl 1,2-cyclic phosphodiesterase